MSALRPDADARAAAAVLFNHYGLAASARGDADAQYQIGCCYYLGEGVAQDFVEAVRYYRMAAEQRTAHAQFVLGGCYEAGQGVAQDWVEAVRYYRLAAAQGNADAQCHQGWLLLCERQWPCLRPSASAEFNNAPRLSQLAKPARDRYAATGRPRPSDRF
jgi:hypothetical protein